MNELISVIIPFYNVGEYIRDCLTSVVIQTYKNLEILLIDDGSNDNSIDIARSFEEKDSRIKIIQKENGGLSDARNHGLEYVNGEYVLFIDSDDFVPTNHIETLYKLLKENNADIACAREEYFYSHTKREHYHKFGNIKTYENGRDILLDLFSFKTPTLTAWNKLFKKEIISKYRFQKDIYYEDLDLIPMIFMDDYKVVCSPKINYQYRIRPQSIIHSSYSKKNDAIYHITRKYIELFHKEKYVDTVLEKFCVYQIKTIIDLFKNLSFSNYENKKYSIEDCKDVINVLNNHIENKSLLTKREKLLIKLINMPQPIYKSFIRLHSLIRR